MRRIQGEATLPLSQGEQASFIDLLSLRWYPSLEGPTVRSMPVSEEKGMSSTVLDETRLKALVKEALVELL